MLIVKQIIITTLMACAGSTAFQACFAQSAQSPPAGMQAIGGRWYVKQADAGDKPLYLYQDAERFVDLFSYHQQDSNQDGIDNLRLSRDGDFLIMESQGYPNHPTAIFPNSDNPNTIRVQRFTFRLPLKPQIADDITRLPMGPVGVALNGVVFFNPFEATEISREGNTLSATINVPQDAPLGVFLDCHIEFGDGAQPTVLKRNDVLRVVE